MKRNLIFVACSAAACFATSAAAAPVNLVDYASLTGSELITFEDLPQLPSPGTNYDGIFVSGGVGFAERFVGQALATAGGFDQLSGSPTGPLSLQVGAAGQNTNVFAGTYGGQYGNVLDGLGPAGFPSFDAIGEGAFALLFSTDQSQFGFQLVGGNGGSAFIDFFARDGSKIDSITLNNLADAFYGFSRDQGTQDIAGISIWNNDAAGIGIDDIRHDVRSNINPVPEPTTMLLFGSGMAGLAAVGRRREKK
jgi:hypothetical protein